MKRSPYFATKRSAPAASLKDGNLAELRKRIRLPKATPPPLPPPPPIHTFGEDQKRVIEAFETGKSFFFTGPAGSGKSHVLRHCITLAKKKYGASNVGVVASTGIAAVNIRGCTVHHFSGAGIGTDPIAKIIAKIKRTKGMFFICTRPHI